MKKKVFLFDFDKTLTDEDSIFLLWKYAIKNKKVTRFFYYRNMLAGGIKYLGSKDFRDIKNRMCMVLNYLTDEDLELFVDYLYNNHILKEGEEYFNNLEDGYKMLVSASPTNYLKYVKKYFDFDVIMGTDLDVNFKIMGKNNKHQEKVRRINEYLKDIEIEIDYENSSGFSDSYSDDKPMLEMVKNRYLINSDKDIEGYNNLTWK